MMRTSPTGAFRVAARYHCKVWLACGQVHAHHQPKVVGCHPLGCRRQLGKHAVHVNFWLADSAQSMLSSLFSNGATVHVKINLKSRFNAHAPCAAHVQQLVPLVIGLSTRLSQSACASASGFPLHCISC